MANHEAENDEIVKDEANKLITIKPRGLHIIWGKQSRYWQLPKKNPQGQGVRYAELNDVVWLEINGSAEVGLGKTYAIQFKVSMKEDAYGWSGCPVFMIAKVGKNGKYTWKKINSLDEKTKQTGPILIPADGLKISVPPTGPEKTIFFGLYEVWSRKWKRGLQIHEATIAEN